MTIEPLMGRVGVYQETSGCLGYIHENVGEDVRKVAGKLGLKLIAIVKWTEGEGL